MELEEMKSKFKNNGYYMEDDVAKKVFLFEKSGKNNNYKMAIPTMLLQGSAGSGKTSLVENFSKVIDANFLFMQCVPGMGIENLQMEPNIKAILKNDSDNAIKKGLLIRALDSSREKATVVLLDEIDKTRADTDSFLLDFIQNGRISTGTEEFQKGDYPIYLMLTSNDERDLSEALQNRCRKVELNRLSKEKFLNALNLPQDHYLGYIYDHNSDFSLRQANMYLSDINTLGVEYDEEVLEQYVEDLDVDSIEDFERASSIGKYTNVYGVNGLNINFNLQIEPYIIDVINKLKLNFELNSNNIDSISLPIDSAKQLVELDDAIKKYADSDSYYLSYRGWVETESDDLKGARWTENDVDNMKLGFVIRDGEEPLRAIKRNTKKEQYLVYVDSDSQNVYTLNSIKKMKEKELKDKKIEDEKEI